MATFKLSSVGDIWPPGTVVPLWLRTLQRSSLEGTPTGSPVATGTVATDGSLSYVGLADDTGYLAAAQVAGGWYYKQFHTDAPLSGATDSVTASALAGHIADPAAHGILARQALAEKGQPNGYAGLDVDGLVPQTQLPLSAGIPAATSSVSGTVRLAGDLGGTSTAPTVPTKLDKAQNLADVPNKATARQNMGLGTASTIDAPTTGNASTGQAVRGDDTRLTDARTPIAHTHPWSDLSGTPAATTAAADDNSTRVATTAYVAGQGGSATPVVDGTGNPGTSPRFARQDHVHPTDTSRAPLASPTFTGTPAAPAPASTTASTQIATTAFARGVAGLQVWAAAVPVVARELRVAPDGSLIVSSSARTTGASYDTTEATNWTTVGVDTTDVETLVNNKLTKPTNTGTTGFVPVYQADGTTLWTAQPTGGSTDSTVTANAATSGTYRGSWASATAYAVNDIVLLPSGYLGRVLTAHTSNAAGYQIDLEKWKTEGAKIAPDLLMPVTGLYTGDPGAGADNPPVSGLWPVRARRSSYHRGTRIKKIATTDVAMAPNSPQTGTIAASTTAPGGAVRLTSTSGTASSSAFNITLGSTVDLSGSVHLRFPVYIGNTADVNFIGIRLYSDGVGNSTGANFHGVSFFQNPTIWLRSAGWCMVSVPLSDFTVTGTGATLTAVNIIQVRMSRQATTNTTLDLQFIDVHPNVADKAKCVLWFDDGKATQISTAVPEMIKRGFPGTLAWVANNFTDTAQTIGTTVEYARYLQDMCGWQIAVHAYGINDHNSVVTGDTLEQQLLRYKHFAAAMGFWGVDDAAYWSSGNAGWGTVDQYEKMRKLFRSVRSTQKTPTGTIPVGDPMSTPALQVSGSTTSTYTTAIDQAIACKGLVQLIWHDIDVTATLTTILDYLVTNKANIEVVTIADVFRAADLG